MAFSGSSFGNTSTNLFGARPSTFGSTQPTTGNVLANAPPLGSAQSQSTTGAGAGTGTNAFGNFGQQQQGSTGIFGSSTAQPAAAGGGLFGQSTTATQPASGGLFGNTTTQPQPGGGLFGQQPTQQQPAAGGGLFGQQPTQQQSAAGGGLFGQQPGQQQPAAGGGLFGQQPGQQQPAAGGGLFGQQPGQQQPAAGGGLFGQQPGQQQPAAGGGLFGQQPAQQQPATGGGLFGQQTTQQQPASSGLFGSNTQQPAAAAGGQFGGSNQPASSLFGSTGTSNIFGSTGQQQQQPSTGLFSSTAGTNPLTAQSTQPAGAFGASTTGAFGGGSLFGKPQTVLTFNQSTFGQPSQQPGQQVQNIAPFAFTKSTKFNDLPDDMKQLLEGIDTHIQGRVQISKDLNQRKLGEEPTKGQEMIKQMQKDLLNASSVIRSDLRHTEDLKTKVDQAMQDTIVAARIIDAFRNPQSGTSYLKDHAGFPLEYFQRVTQQMTERLAWYKSTIEQIERRLSSSATQVQTPQSIAATLQAQHATFLALASKTAALETELQKLKAIYVQLWRAKTGSARDPFNDGDRVAESPGDLGLSSLVVK